MFAFWLAISACCCIYLLICSLTINLGHVINNTVQQVFQSLIHKALTENKYELLYDEIKGLDGFEWTRFDCTKSQVLHISSNNIKVSDVILAVDINIIKKFNPYNKKEDQVS